MSVNNKKKKQNKSQNPWNNQEMTLERLKEAYPKLPEPHLLRCWKVYMHHKSLNEQDRKKFMKDLDAQPQNPNILDFKDEITEYKGNLVVTKESSDYQEPEPLPTIVKLPEEENENKATTMTTIEEIE